MQTLKILISCVTLVFFITIGQASASTSPTNVKITTSSMVMAKDATGPSHYIQPCWVNSFSKERWIQPTGNIMCNTTVNLQPVEKDVALKESYTTDKNPIAGKKDYSPPIESSINYTAKNPKTVSNLILTHSAILTSTDTYKEYTSSSGTIQKNTLITNSLLCNSDALHTYSFLKLTKEEKGEYRGLLKPGTNIQNTFQNNSEKQENTYSERRKAGYQATMLPLTWNASTMTG